jgi:lysozyme
MNISTQGLDLIKSIEGFRSHIYKDMVGIPTTRYGHALRPGEWFPNGITEDQASELLHEDVAFAEHAVNSLVKLPLTQGQYDALVDFTYNLGSGTLKRSTLLHVLNEKRYGYVADQFLAWDHADGVEVDGLKRRREAEREMFVAGHRF